MRYVPTVTTEVSSGESPLAEALEKRGDEQAGIMSQVGQFAQKKVDEQEQQEGAKAALEQGANFKPDENFTEAGQAFNAGAKPVATVMATNDMQQHLTDLYNEQIQKPYSPSTIEDYSKVSDAYFGDVLNNSPAFMHQILTQQYEGLKGSYTRRLSNQMAANTLNVNQANAEANLNQTNNAYATAAYNLPLHANPKQIAALQGLGSLKTSATSAALANHAITPTQAYALQNKATQQNYQQKGLGIARNLLEQASVPGADTNAIFKQLSQLANNPDTSPSMQQFMEISGMKSSDVSPQTRMLMQYHIQSLIHHAQLRTAGDKGAQEASNKNVVLGSENGVQPTPVQFSKLNLIDQQTTQGNLAGNAIAISNATSPNFSMKTAQSKILEAVNDPKYAGYSNIAKKALIQNANARLAQIVKQVSKTPVMFAQSSPSYINTLNQQANMLPNSKDKIKNLYNNPLALATNELSEPEKQALKKVYTQGITIQANHNVPMPGIFSENQINNLSMATRAMTPQQASAVFKGIRDNLITSDGHTLWGYFQAQFFNSKNPDINHLLYPTYSGNNNNPAAQQTGMELQESESYLANNPKGIEGIDTRSLRNAVQRHLLNLQNTYFHQEIQGGQQAYFMQALTKGAMQIAMYNLLTKGDPTADYNSVASDAVGSMVNPLFHSVNAGDTYRVPTTITTINGDKSIDKGAVDDAVADYDFDAHMDYTAGIKSDKTLKASAYKTWVENGTWINSPSGTGLIRKDSHNNVVIGKNGKPLSINYLQATKEYGGWLDRHARNLEAIYSYIQPSGFNWEKVNK